MNIIIIIQARMTSTRLPGKVIKEVMGKPLLEYQIERLSRIPDARDVVIATTIKETDNPIVELCNKLGIATYRGSEDDVLERYYETACKYKADVIVRITADCPLIDPKICDAVIRYYLVNRDKLDYVRMERYPRGLDTEVFPFKVLAQCYNEAVDQPDREHVTPFIYRNPGRFRVGCYTSETDYSHCRWTVDTPEDFELIKRIIKTLYPSNRSFSFQDILTLLHCNHEWSLINASVQQKHYGQ